MNAVTTTRAGRREWVGLGVIALPGLLYAMDLTVLNLAVPHLSADRCGHHRPGAHCRRLTILALVTVQPIIRLGSLAWPMVTLAATGSLDPAGAGLARDAPLPGHPRRPHRTARRQDLADRQTSREDGRRAIRFDVRMSVASRRCPCCTGASSRCG